jgi:hypothetical protein
MVLLLPDVEYDGTSGYVISLAFQQCPTSVAFVAAIWFSPSRATELSLTQSYGDTQLLSTAFPPSQSVSFQEPKYRLQIDVIALVLSQSKLWSA